MRMMRTGAAHTMTRWACFAQAAETETLSAGEVGYHGRHQVGPDTQVGDT